jgi:hypothetical protein
MTSYFKNELLLGGGGGIGKNVPTFNTPRYKYWYWYLPGTRVRNDCTRTGTRYTYSSRTGYRYQQLVLEVPGRVRVRVPVQKYLYGFLAISPLKT